MTKYKFSIIAPHQDDEFIGCKTFFEYYKNNIDNVVFVTNGERSIFDFPDTFHYIKTRREESESWIHDQNPRIQIHYLNIPDGMSLKDFRKLYGKEMFQILNNMSQEEYIKNKIKKIVANNILLIVDNEKHPSHCLTHYLCTDLTNKKITYASLKK